MARSTAQNMQTPDLWGNASLWPSLAALRFLQSNGAWFKTCVWGIGMIYTDLRTQVFERFSAVDGSVLTDTPARQNHCSLQPAGNLPLTCSRWQGKAGASQPTLPICNTVFVTSSQHVFAVCNEMRHSQEGSHFCQHFPDCCATTYVLWASRAAEPYPLRRERRKRRNLFFSLQLLPLLSLSNYLPSNYWVRRIDYELKLHCFGELSYLKGLIELIITCQQAQLPSAGTSQFAHRNGAHVHPCSREERSLLLPL